MVTIAHRLSAMPRWAAYDRAPTKAVSSRGIWKSLLAKDGLYAPVGASERWLPGEN